jgi:hypothetical protein
MYPPLISGPIPPYNNPPIEPQFFKPSQFKISNITFGQTTIVTTTTDMNYVVGQLVRLVIPSLFGCSGLNEQTGYVISTPAANQVEITINSINISPFVAFSTPSSVTPPQIVAVGDVNSGLISSTGRSLPTTTIPGSFQNISPL